MAEHSRVTSWFIDGPRKMGWSDVGIMMLAVGVPPLVAVLAFGGVLAVLGGLGLVTGLAMLIAMPTEAHRTIYNGCERLFLNVPV